MDAWKFIIPRLSNHIDGTQTMEQRWNADSCMIEMLIFGAMIQTRLNEINGKKMK